jgi:hypothetical protein
VTGSVEVNVTVDDGHLDALDDGAERLQAAGMRLGRTLPALGSITGTVDDPARIGDLMAVEGVLTAEAARTTGIPPPDAPVQ